MKSESDSISDPFELLKNVVATPQDENQWSDDQRRAEAEAGGRIALARAKNIEDFVLQRKKFAWYFVVFSFVWLVFVAIAIVLDGWSIFSFTLGDNVLMALLGTATFKVLAPAYLVAKYLFGNPPD